MAFDHLDRLAGLAHEYGDLNLAQLRILAMVCGRSAPPSMTQISTRLGIALSTVSRGTAVLERAGLVAREAPDARSYLVHPTTRGRAVNKRVLRLFYPMNPRRIAA